MSDVTEFAETEVVTATIHMTAIPSCEAYSGPLHIGYYPWSDEVWIEQEGKRINLPEHHITAIVKQIKRAQKIAAEKTAATALEQAKELT